MDATPDSGWSPRARSKHLLVRPLGEETVVYDLERHRAHSLSRPLASLWRRCDGRTSLVQLARHLEAELGSAVDEGAVWVGLHRLGRAKLLDSLPPALPSRRDWLLKARDVGLVLLAIEVPTLGEAASGISNTDCSRRVPPNCGGAPCLQNPGNTCRPSGGRCSCTQN